MATQEVGGTAGHSTGGNGYIFYFPITAGQDCIVSKVGINLFAGAGKGNIRVSVFVNSGTHPSALVSESASVAAIDGWNDLDLATPVSMVSGVTYQIALQLSSALANFYYATGGDTHLQTYTYAAFPATATPLGYGNTFNMRITYTAVNTEAVGFGIDIRVGRSRRRYVSLDMLVKGTATKTFPIDTQLKKPDKTKTFGIDIRAKVADNTKQFGIDIQALKTVVHSFGIGSLLSKRFTKAWPIGAVLKKINAFKETGIDMMLASRNTKAFDMDIQVKRTLYVSAPIDMLAGKKNVTSSMGIDIRLRSIAGILDLTLEAETRNLALAPESRRLELEAETRKMELEVEVVNPVN